MCIIDDYFITFMSMSRIWDFGQLYCNYVRVRLSYISGGCELEYSVFYSCHWCLEHDFKAILKTCYLEKVYTPSAI